MTTRTVVDKLLLVLASLAFVLVTFGWVAVQPDVFPSLENVPSPVRGDPKRLEAHVRMLSETYSYRDFIRGENLDKAASYIQRSFSEAGWKTQEQPFVVEGRQFKNVIANFGPESQERIVVGAHYDSYNEFPGADDNASGVAGLLELARVISVSRLQPKVKLEFVAWSLEEPPYFGTDQMGSAVHAKGLAKDGVKLRAMISIEMIGFFSDAPHSQSYPIEIARLFYPSVGNFIAVVGGMSDRSLILRLKKAMGQAGPIPVWSMSAPSWIGTGNSDQFSYWAEGYSGVMVTDTAYLRNLTYHTKDDRADRLNYQRMADVVGELGSAVAELSQ